MRGSCIEAPPQSVPGQDEPVRFTFFSDVSVHPEVNEMGLHVKEAVSCGLSQLVAHASTWKKFKLLWRMNKVCVPPFTFTNNPIDYVHGEYVHVASTTF